MIRQSLVGSFAAASFALASTPVVAGGDLFYGPPPVAYAPAPPYYAAPIYVPPPVYGYAYPRYYGGYYGPRYYAGMGYYGGRGYRPHYRGWYGRRW
jgi:hypothetical protein